MFLPNLNVVRFILELLKHCSESKQDIVQLQILNLHLCEIVSSILRILFREAALSKNLEGRDLPSWLE